MHSIHSYFSFASSVRSVLLRAKGLRLLPVVSAIVLSGAGLTSCNLFEPFDSPSSEARLRSQGRACLDSGDYACAREAFTKLQSSNADQAQMGLAIAQIQELGAGFDEFAQAFGTSPSGGGLSTLANRMISTGKLSPGKAARLKMYEAYQRVGSISNASLRELLRFLTATALAAEILAEGSGSDRLFTATDLAVGGLNCQFNTCTNDSCDTGTGDLTTSSEAGNIKTTAPNTDSPSLDQLYYAIEEAVLGLTNLGAGTSTTQNLQAILSTGNGIPSSGFAGARCFRATLIENGVGR